MFEALGSRTFRFRYLIVAAWIVAAVLSIRFGPSLAAQGAADQASFLPPNAPSTLANVAMERDFAGSTSTSSATLTFSREVPLTDADKAYIDAMASWTTSVDAPPIVRDAVTGTESASSRPELKSMLASSDEQLQLLVVNLNVGSAGDQADAIVTALRDHAAATAPAGLVVHVTGSAGISTDYLRAIKAGTDSTTAVTVALVVVILLLIYRAPLAALVPLLTIGAAFVVSRGVLGGLAEAGWKVSSLLDTFLVVLVFGVGTDYTIFLISRFREEVRGQTDWHEASRSTVRRIGAVITASASTVIVGLGAMAFGEFGMIQTTGPALGVAIAVTLVAGLTLAPALLGVFGHYLFWPLHDQPKLEGEPTGLFSRLSAAVSRHPGMVVVGLLVALLIPAGFLPQMKTNFDVLAELPANSDARIGFDLVSAHLGRGKLVQTSGLIDTGSSDMLAPAQLGRLRDAMIALQSTPGVSTVTSIVTPNGDGVVPDELRPSVQLRTIGGAFGEGGASGSASSGSSASVLDPAVSSGLADALDYVGAVGAAFPDVAGRSEYRAARNAITGAQDLVDRIRKQSVVATQLRTLATALTSPTAAVSGSGSNTGLVAAYLKELAAAYPEVDTLTAFRDAMAAATSLRRTATAGAVVDAANALDALAIHFDSKPDATLSPKSLANTPTALEAKREAKATFAAIPPALTSLAGVFAGRSDDIFIPLGLGGSEAQRVTDAVGAFMSTDRTASRFYLTIAEDPYSPRAFAITRAAAVVMADAAPGFGPAAQTYIGGPTAQFSDVQDVLASDFNRVGIITVLGIFVVLVVLLRAIVAPLYLVGTVLVSYGSAVGLSAWLFQEPLGQPGASFYLPLIVFVLLVALGSDYNIFLMSRVREESESRPIRDGIRVASGHTGAVITSAGLILAGTFGSMATAQLIVLFQVGVAVAIGVLIDTFVVRSILVPAITTLVGDRAWWPSGIRFARIAPAAGEAAGPAGAVGREGAAGTAGAVAGGTLARGVIAGGATGAELAVSGATLPVTGLALVERERHSPLRIVVALLLAMLVPATFAGLITWAQQPSSAATVRAAVVNADEGAAVTAADGTTQQLELGATLASRLAGRATGGSIAWETADATTAADGLASGRYSAVLTIPSGFSRAIAAIRADSSGSQPAATLDLETASSSGSGGAATSVATRTEVARELRDAITASATSDATASYVSDVLLAVSASHAGMESAASDAQDIATRTTSLATDADGIHAVAGEMVSGLDQLASGAAAAVEGTNRLVSATRDLAAGTQQLSGGAASLATGAGSASAGAKELASGAASLSAGLLALESQTAGLPSQAATLASGATDLASGASAAASGADQLSDGLATMKSQTSGLGAQAQAMSSGAASLVNGASSLASGANLASAAATSLASGATALKSGIGSYTDSVSGASVLCLATYGPASPVCAALAGLASPAAVEPLVGGADGVSTGASQLAGSMTGLASGAGDLKTGAASLASGVATFAASAPALESGIAQSAAGAASLADGTASVATGAATLAAGTKQFSDGMPALVGGISSASSGASSVDSGAASLSSGVADLASGASTLATGSKQTAAGAAALASNVASSAGSTGQLTDGVKQAIDGARLVQAETAQLGTTAATLANDASRAAQSLQSTAAAGTTYPADARTRIADRVAQPISVEAPGSGTGTEVLGQPTTAIAPFAMALALWLGALGALLVLPSGRRERQWPTVLGWYVAASGFGLVAGGLMLAVLRFGPGLEVARPAELVGVAILAVLAFAAVVQALVVLFGTRGWLVALLLAAVQAAAAGYPVAADALPGPLAFVHPLLPVSWTVEALQSCIDGTGGIATAAAVLVAWLVAALLVSLAVTLGTGRRATHIAAPA